MSDTSNPAPQTDPASEAGAFHLDWRVARAFGNFAGKYWTGSTQQQAWALTLGLAASLLFSTYVTVALNSWNRAFFDALERRDAPALKQAVLLFFIIIASMAAVGVCIVWCRMTLQVRWRQWLVERLLGVWLERQKFYHMNATGLEPPNPEYRISDDTRWATEIMVDLGIGLLTALVGGAAFIAILWKEGGSFTIGGIHVPGFMVWCALAYGFAASALTAYVGRPLVGRVGQKNEAEGSFRFAMMRLRDNAESVALAHGAKGESSILQGFYDTVVLRWQRIVRSISQLTWITNATGPMIPIVPLLFATPKYMAGELTLGQVTQLAAAFVQVQQAISWIVDNYQRFADWYASARRVMDIVDASERVAGVLPAEREPSAAPGNALLALDHVALSDKGGHALLKPISLRLARGEAVHMAGPSNTGKSTLARLLAGLVEPTGGSIKGVGTASILLLPQKSYLPLGTLAEALAYPQAVQKFGRGDLHHALHIAGLDSLTPRLDETARWDQLLSAGERQRLLAARTVLARPQLLVIDDALSALDGPGLRALVQSLRQEIKGLTILSLGQRAAPSDTFDRTLELTRHEQDAMLSESVG